MSKSKAAVAMGKRRAANLTALDRSTNARTGWRRKHGPDHVTADQWRVLSHLRECNHATVEVGKGPAGDRFLRALDELDNRNIVDIFSLMPPAYERGPAWVDQKHIRVASKKST